MTAIAYPDCQAISPNGQFSLEARSPENGTIRPQQRPKRSRQRTFASQDRCHQRGFRYQLLDNSHNGEVLWERWQERFENSPHEVVVSDDGWSILRTHGFSPELIVVSPDGEDVIRVRIDGPDRGDAAAEVQNPEQPLGQGTRYRWCADHLVFSTAGLYWTEHSWRCFFTLHPTNYFVWRPYWGQRLVLDLTNAFLIDEQAQANPTLQNAIRQAEILSATHHLASLAGQTSEIQRLLDRNRDDSEVENNCRLSDSLKRATGAIHLIGVHRVAACVPLLRWLETIDAGRYSTGSTAMGENWWVEVQSFRPILHHALRLLGEEPQGYAAHHFTQDRVRFPMPECVENRRGRAASLNPSMNAEQVLQRLGSPDHVRRESYPVGKFYQWREYWEYDFHVDGRWETLRIVWEQQGHSGRIDRLDVMPSPWLNSDERVMQILGFG
ncbi:hypothetical protein [Tuwongella immobilis]|nr:hypothetical protein [Tuwongella immobilis]